MSRYIDADAAREAVIERWKKRIEEYGDYYDTGCEYGKNDDLEWLDSLPTIDAVPVRHGEWIIKPHGTYGQLRAFCSACGKHSGIGGIVSNQKKPYCPNCGAIMDGKEIVDG